jgi:hypothetical protein
MTTRLDKTLKRELTLEGRTFTVAVSPEGLKLTLKGKRKGHELRWGDLISGDAALAAALNASVGTFERSKLAPVRKDSPTNEKPVGEPEGAVQGRAASKQAAARGKAGRSRPVRPKSKHPSRARRR